MCRSRPLTATMPKAVDVLMPVRNAAPYLQRALRSLTAQRFTDFQVIAIDDGSTDDSADILQEEATREPRLTWSSRSNSGVIATRNELLARATAPWVAWMDADDVSLPDRLQRQVDESRSHPAAVCVGTWTRQIDPSGRWLGIESFPIEHDSIVAAQWNGGGMRFPSTMMKREVATRVGGFREPFRMGEDLDFLFRLSERGVTRNVPAVLYHYRQHLDSICATTGADWFATLECILELARERRDLGSDRLQRGEPVSLIQRRAKPTRMQAAHVYAYWARAASANADLKLTVEYLARSIVAHPLGEGWRLAARLLLRHSPFGSI